MILILGGGLAGLSTAYHLGDATPGSPRRSREVPGGGRGIPHLVVEGESTPGGLCRSREVDGFVFDYTGHLLHLRDERAKAMVDDLLPNAFTEIERKARVRMRGVTLPFPFQANLHGLPKPLVADALVGFVESLGQPIPDDPRTSFEAWSLAVFGRAISDLFMLPYNEKLFRRAPAEMTADWVSWAVPKPTLDELVRGALGIENRGMGYNATFRYPRQGGIGVLPEALAQRVKCMRLGQRAVEVDLDRRRVVLSGGEKLEYERLVVTLPLPAFLKMARTSSSDLAGLADRLDWSVVGCVNLGVDRAEIADGAHWIYTPDREVPFYRVGFPSNIAPGLAPRGTSSMYVEYGLRRDERFDVAALEAAAVNGLRRLGILAPGDKVLASDTVRIDPGYVIFDRDRQDVMARVVPELAQQGVDLIGRYGAWTYSYMERALLDGLELAESIRGERICSERICNER